MCDPHQMLVAKRLREEVIVVLATGDDVPAKRVHEHPYHSVPTRLSAHGFRVTSALPERGIVQLDEGREIGAENRNLRASEAL